MTIPTPPVNPGKALDDLNTYVAWSGQTIGGLSGQVDSLTGQNTALVAANASLAAENESLVADNAALARANADLSAANVQLAADLAACQANGGGDPDPEPEPQPLRAIFGSSKNDAVPGMPKVAIGRVYYGGQINSTWNSGPCRDYVNAATQAIWASFKAEPGADVENFIKSIATSPLAGFDYNGRKIKVIVTVNHEPENDTPLLDVGVYNRRYAALKAISDKYDYCLFGPIRMNSKSQSVNDQYWPTVPVDFDGWDCYNPGIQTPKAYVDPATVYQKVLASSVKTGRPLFIGETGSGKTSSDSSGTGRRAWAKSCHDFLAAQEAVGPTLWWNSAGCAFGDTATASAWFAG